MVACYADGCVLALGHEPEPHQAANGHTWPSVHPRPRKDTHCTRLLDVLADGKPHDHLSLYRLNMIVHSRVSELRKRGYRIEMRRDGDLYLYRLLNAGLTEREAIAGGPEPDGTCVWPLPLREPEVTEPCCVEPDPWLPPRAHRDAGDHRDAGNYPSPQARGGRALQSSEQLTLTVAA